MKKHGQKLGLFFSSFCILFCFSFPAIAEELIEKTVQVSSAQAEPIAAKKDLTDKAVLRVTEEVSRELMGNEKFEKNKGVILTKIAKMSGRFISYVKPGDLAPQTPGPGYNMTFVMKVSPLTLKTLLQNQGLMSESDTLPVVLPLINFQDRVLVGTYKWWQPGDVSSKRFLVNQARQLENSMRQSFKKQNFHIIKTMEMNASQLLPNSFQNDRMSPDDMQFLGRMFQAPLVVEGKIEYNRSPVGANVYQIEIKLSAIQLANGKPIADVARKYETEAGAFENVSDKKMKQVLDSVTQDLASQVFEAWQKGTVGTKVIKLTLRGNIPVQQRELLKERIRTHIPQIKNIRERVIEGAALTFEVDSSSSTQEIGQRISQLDLNGLKFQPSSSTEQEVVVDIKK